MPEEPSQPGKTWVQGTTTEGASDSRAVARAVREMFTSIAPRYDLLNHVLSANVDKLWWRQTARSFERALSRPGVKVLDLCCGTGDMAFAVMRQSPAARLMGVDFSHAMLRLASAKSRTRSLYALVSWVEADALQLPFADRSFDLVTSAFGFRNLADYDAGLREIRRVLRPGGECGILEFSQPAGLLGWLYHLYFRHVLPKIGTMLSGVPGAYAYLPSSVARFPSASEMLARMRTSGFSKVAWRPYTGGIAGLFRGER
ncbi:MAG: bifunctional demethylmenaquinone methyltransferase/2-methoxy-6-polyprenyl-1,4-benzoquinol methylase UbiE [Acidobacteria bacterium]|nr:bifunctional demethylmenaquinone methyltransferase/2-methoxy-6-polyprenyl-1,4-benzoquinol methylase UbiE [Acidobacteriota bacterium]